MRPQQNRRMRGRTNNNGNNNNNNNNNNRRGPNPLSRNYESNGPDVKIRGNAQHIAEKYQTLARDAQGAGDRVMAENYLQHAEHYMRIILAAQAQMPQPIQRDETSDDDNDDDNNNNEQISDQEDNNADQEEAAGSGPQPEIEGIPAEVAFSKQTTSSDDNEKRNRRPQRRRMPRHVDGEDARAATSKPVSEISEDAIVKTVSAPVVDAVVSDSGEEEKKIRRRRPVKPKVEEKDA